MGTFKAREVDLFPSDLEFNVFSSEDVKKISVVKILTGLTYDAIGHPLPGGLYDALMGTHGDRHSEPCATCHEMVSCPGHMGHIELNTLVYNPLFIKTVHKILSIHCLNCFKIQLTNHVRDMLILQLRLVDAGFIIEAQELEVYKSEAVCQNTVTMVKVEHGGTVHPRVAELEQMLKKSKANAINTKTSYALRTAVVNAGTQPRPIKRCIHCSDFRRTVRYQYRKLVYFITAAELQAKNPDNKTRAGQTKVAIADETRNILRQIYNNCPELLKLLFPVLKGSNMTNPTDMFFMDTVPVTPPKARPAAILENQIREHSQTTLYRHVVENNSVLRVVLKHIKNKGNDMATEAIKVYETCKGENSYEKLYNSWEELQNSVNQLLDTSTSRENFGLQGLKQILEKKEGLIRKHMMGKRVNYAARTVITPDPNINVEEVGIPDVFAKKLSYPVPVTGWNVSELRKMVINGPLVHPGANYIEDERGYTTLIPADNQAKRESMAKLLLNFSENETKIVHRHLLNGDVLLLNRQPTLHRPSIMAHKARILSGEKTFRLHYSNCKAYNADFDGDEMNAHYPQNEVARSEAYNLVNVANNYLVPKDGTPLGGLIQDHVISGVKLSIRGRFFNREDYQQLVFQGLAHTKRNVKLLPPAILKPCLLWSGKQILSTIIINLIPKEYPLINLQSGAKIGAKQWTVDRPRLPMCGKKLNDVEMSESEVCIKNGELLTGVLDKQQYGATTYGLIHCVYELYGGEISTNLLTAFTKVFTFFLQREGFTLGVKDILITPDADSTRRKIIKECREVGEAAVAAALDLQEVPPVDILAEKMEQAYLKDPKFRVIIDRKYKAVLDEYTNQINKTCLPNGLTTKFPDNNLQLMVLSGAKGSMVNTMQISCLLGQIELEGKRPPLMISGKSLPSFASFETSPKSGGFIDGRFMTGIQPQDFFFHCMAGREGLIDTAVKTSRSGYLQRCLIKHLEGLTVNYDLTVRDSDNTIVQFLYGEDGLDILKSKFMHDKFGASFLAQNSKAVLRPAELETLKDPEILSKVTRHAKKIKSWLKHNKGSQKRQLSAFVHFSAELRDEVEVENPNEINPETGRRRLDEGILKLWREANPESKELYRQKYQRCPDPTTSIFKQDLNYGSVSESVERIVRECRSNQTRKSVISEIMSVKNMKSLVAPGEPVGLLAAQSIGEPSTQMTLNTFHFAGRGEMNVTLGIPRLREILMLASQNIKTPSMDIPIVANKERHAEKLRVKLNRVTLADVLQTVNVKIKLVLKPDRSYQYQLRFQFLPREVYKENFCVRPKNILKYMSEIFFKNLFQRLTKPSKKKDNLVEFDGKKNTASKELDENLDKDESDDEHAAASTNSKRKNPSVDIESGESSDEAGDDDDDAGGIKLKERNKDETEYDDPEEVEVIEDDDEDEVVEMKKGGREDEDDDITFLPDLNESRNAAGSAKKLDDEMVNNVLSNGMVNDYIYDKKDYLWCQLTFNLGLQHKNPDLSNIIRDLAHKSVIHQVQNINRAIIYTNDKDEQLLKTDGINIVEMCNHNIVLDLNRLYSNDIHAVAKTYGIEAATQVIMKEVTNVFKVYGITVNRRHLSLVADYMTFDGTFQSLSRKGIESSSSPLQQMSFESCMKFLTSAISSGRSDQLNSPSSRLMAGLPVRHGTGCFELLTSIV